MKKKQENFFKKYRGVGSAIALGGLAGGVSGGVAGLMAYGAYKGLKRLSKNRKKQ